MRFIREVKRRNPDSEIIVQHYTPVPHPDGMYGVEDGALPFPKSPDEWAQEEWAKFAERKNPSLPWLPKEVRRKIDAFELVLACRWPTVQDTKMPGWARALLRLLGSWRYALGRYEWPWELRLARRLLKPREPKVESI